MNRIISVILAVCLLLALGSCRAGDLTNGPDQSAQAPTGIDEPTPTPTPEPSPEPPEDEQPWKVAIFTSIANNEPEYATALNAVEQYEGRIVLKSIDFYSYTNTDPPEDETVLSEMQQFIEDPEIGALIFIDAGNLDAPIALLKGIMEVRPDISYTYINCWPDLHYSYRTDNALMEKVDIALSIDLVETAKKAVNQANVLGAEMCVDYAYWFGEFESHRFFDEDTPWVLPEVRDAIREECEKLGMEHLISPWGDRLALTSDWPMSDIITKLNIYGKNICIFSNRCMYQFFIYMGVFGYGEMIVQLCHPGLFHADYYQNVGYPLGQIKDNENHFGDLEWTLENAKAVIEEFDYSGRFATWRVPFSMAATVAAVEYATGYLDGAIESPSDYAAMKGCFARAMESYNAGDIGFELNIDPRYGNHFMFTQEYIVL